MRVLILLFIVKVNCNLWPNGVVHFDFNNKDYDLHSQDEIMSVFQSIEKEICVKFFLTPTVSESGNDKILFINNPDKRKTCSNDGYDYSQTVVNMTIGYKCINPKEISKKVVDMLRASISREIPRDTENKEMEIQPPNLLSIEDRNYINKFYNNECNKLNNPNRISVKSLRRMATVADGELSDDNIQYYSDKIWPQGVVKYKIDIDEGTVLEPFIKDLEMSMTLIEGVSCIIFEEESDDVLETGNYVSFVGNGGAEMPKLGIQIGNQIINIRNMSEGEPGHKSHILMNLMKILGFPMESNRMDRNNYVNILWKNIEKGREQYFELEKEPSLLHLPYDFDSVTHAPVNWMCGDKCRFGAQTVKPIGDHLWRRTMTIGRNSHLSETDIKKINMIYSHECKKREKQVS